MIEHVYRRASAARSIGRRHRRDRRSPHRRSGAGVRRRRADDVGRASERHRSARGSRGLARLRPDRQRPGRRAADRPADDRRSRRAVRRRSSARDEHAAQAHRRRRRAAQSERHEGRRRRAAASRCTSPARRFRSRRDGCPPAPAWRHVGLYVYRRDTLLRLAALPPVALERAEALEQLRALAHGIAIKCVETTCDVDRRRHAGRSRARARAGRSATRSCPAAPRSTSTRMSETPRDVAPAAPHGRHQTRQIHPRHRRRRLVARQGPRGRVDRRAARGPRLSRSRCRSSIRTSTSTRAR